jgi:PAS domain S-box-containing protein
MMNSEDSISPSEDLSPTVAGVEGKPNLNPDADVPHDKSPATNLPPQPPQPPQPMNQAAQSSPIPATATDQALRTSELSYRRLFEAARDGILILDVDTGRITDVNPFLMKMLGFSHGEMVGKTVGELSPFKDILSNQAMLERLQKDGYVRYDDLPLETRDGRKIPVEFVSNIYPVGDKKVIQCNIRDITARKRAEAALLEAPPDKVAWQKSSAVKDLTHVCLATALVFVVTWYFNLSNMFLHWMQGRAETLMDETFTALNFLLLGFLWFGFRRWREVHHQAAGRQRVTKALEELRADLETRVLHRTADLARTNENLCAEITERKRAEETLRLLESAVDQSKESIMITDAQLDLPGPKIIFVNPAYTQMTGYPAAEVIGKTPRILQGPRTDKTVLRRLRQNLEQGKSFASETINYRKDGTEFDLEWQIAPIRDPGGKITHFVATQHDISERKQVENALRAGEERMRLATEATGVGIWEWNVLTNQIRWDAQMFRIYGITPTKDGLVEYGIWSRSVLLEDVRKQEELLQDTVRRRGHGSRKFRIRRADNQELRHIQSVETVRINAQGQAEWVVGTNLDITERKRTRDELIAKTALLEAQVDSALDGILVVNEQHKVILNNQRLFQLFEIPDDIVRDDDHHKMIQYVTGQMKDPEKFTAEVDYLYAHPEEIGREEIELASGRILDRYSAPIRAKTGKHYGRIWTFRDITEQRKLEAQFRQSQKMDAIGQLAGGVAHDFNNIMAVIQMQADLLTSGGNLSAGQTELADDIGVAVQRATALTRQLLLFSRKEALQPRDLDLNQTVNELTKMLTRTLGENIAVQLNLAAQPMFLHADAGMMDQVLMNLAVNARDAMPDGGRLVIETAGVEFDEFAARQTVQARPGSFVRLSVSDNGCGIPPENLSKIFDPFFTTKGVGKGTGLGLATVFGIAKQHQGWINVYSEVGHGTTFKVYLPRLAEAHDTTLIRKLPATAQTGYETILLVEDEPALRTMINLTLSRLGYRVMEASTGFKALAVWKEHPAEIHLLLTDLMMPDGMSGKELGQRLLQENPKLKVIYMSGYSAGIVAKDFPLQEGVNFLIKPFQVQQLAQTIRDCLDAIPSPPSGNRAERL